MVNVIETQQRGFRTDAPQHDFRRRYETKPLPHGGHFP